MPESWFQFLIGRLITSRSHAGSSFCLAFQFLIGRLITELAYSYKRLGFQFQFLIGRLITGNNVQMEEVFLIVSIPHR